MTPPKFNWPQRGITLKDISQKSIDRHSKEYADGLWPYLRSAVGWNVAHWERTINSGTTKVTSEMVLQEYIKKIKGEAFSYASAMDAFFLKPENKKILRGLINKYEKDIGIYQAEKIERNSKEYFEGLEKYLLQKTGWKSQSISGLTYDSTDIILNYIKRAKGETASHKDVIDKWFSHLDNKNLLAETIKQYEEDIGLNKQPTAEPEVVITTRQQIGPAVGQALLAIGPHEESELKENILQFPLPKYENKSLQVLLDEAKSLEDIQTIETILAQMETIQGFENIPASLWESLHQGIESSRKKIALETIVEQIKKFEGLDIASLSAEEALAKYNQIPRLSDMRKQLVAVPDELDAQLRNLHDQLHNRLLELKPEIKNRITGLFAEMQGICDKMISVGQITALYGTSQYKEYITLSSVLSSTEKGEFETRFNALVQQTTAMLQEKQKSEENKKEMQKQELIDTIDKKIVQLKDIVGHIQEVHVLESVRKSNPMVEEIKSLINSPLLTPIQQSTYLEQIKNIFQAKILAAKLNTSKEEGLRLEDYGINASLYYQEHDADVMGYKVIGNRTADNKVRLGLQLENGGYHNFDIDLLNQDIETYGKVIPVTKNANFETTMTQPDFIKYGKELAERKKSGKAELRKLTMFYKKDMTKKEKEELSGKIKKIQQKYADARYTDILVSSLVTKLNINPRPFVKPLNKKFVVLDEEKSLFKNITDGLVIQKESQKGIEILEGPPGLGKTEMCSFIASATNREIIRIQCAKMDPNDMFFAPQLKANETTRQPAQWIKLMQKPGSIILFDEIDKLSPECFERLHSLFDAGRSIYDPQLGDFRANPDCVFIGTRNSYEIMSNPITSRSTITRIEAPSEMNEAYKVSKYTEIAFFEELSYDQFKDLRNKYTSSGFRPHQNELEHYKMFTYIQGLVGILNQIRKTWQEAQKVSYEVSYRDSEQIFQRYNKNPGIGFKQKVIDILIPKVRAVVETNYDKDEQEKIVTKIIDNTLS